MGCSFKSGAGITNQLEPSDCFKFHPNYGNDVRQQYINILAELADSSVLSAIATQVAGRTINVTKLSSNLATYIKQSEYALS